MDLLDIFQQYRIEKNKNEARLHSGEANQKALNNQVSIKVLNEKIDHLSLVCMAMGELLENVGFSKAMLLSKIEEIDLRDGSLDGKYAPLNKCSNCSRVVAARHNSCLYCGSKVDKTNAL